MTVRTVDHCGLCGSPNLDTVLDLGTSPPTCEMYPIVQGGFPVQERHPLTLIRCADCTLVQLSTIVDPEIVFPPTYPYSSGNSPALHADFEELARTADGWANLGVSDLVVDIGANDGTLLSKFGPCRTVGVEPTGQAHRIAGDYYNDFFNEQTAAQILADHGPARVITACNVLAHVDDLGTVMRGIDLLLADDGILIAENHDLASVVDEGQWDTVYHEHLRFYSPHSFDRVLDAYGFAVRDCQSIPTHGGSFRVVAGKGQRARTWSLPDRDYDFADLQDRALEAREAIQATVAEGPVWGIGATARATTIINYCGLDVGTVHCVCEVEGSDKIGYYIPGTSIPVTYERFLFEEQPPRAMLFSWHLADRIVPKLREQGYEGEILLPLPTLQTA